MTPIFRGRVLAKGLLVLDRPKDYAAYVRGLAGSFVEVTCRKERSQRSQQANRFYFGAVVPLIADYCGYDKQEMHELLALRFLRIEDDPITKSPRRKHTPETDTQEFSDYVEACIRFAAELGVVVPGPHEVAF